jgi:hypothetical protein
VDLDRLGKGSHKSNSNPQQVLRLAKFSLEAHTLGNLEAREMTHRSICLPDFPARWQATVRIRPQPQRSLSSSLETGFSLFSGELVERFEPEGCSARSAPRSKGLNSGSATDRGVKRS